MGMLKTPSGIAQVLVSRSQAGNLDWQACKINKCRILYCQMCNVCEILGGRSVRDAPVAIVYADERGFH